MEELIRFLSESLITMINIRISMAGSRVKLGMLTACLLIMCACSNEDKSVIKVGVLHSLTGTMAISEASLVDATMMAIEEVNKRGGVLGRQLKPIVVDGASNWEQFSLEAEDLITQDQVSVIFGCWTSACRKAVKPVVEKYNHLLFYPLQYEGLESSPNIVYTGAAPNQQIIPSVYWALENVGKKIYLVGSDYVFPRTANMIIKDLLKNRNISALGETYLPLGSIEVSEVIEDIRQKKPNLIINTINGDSNVAFFRELSKGPAIKVMSYSISETEVLKIGVDFLQGHYAAWNYFQSINTPINLQFVKNFKDKYGQDRVIDDPMEAAYTGVKLWMQAAQTAGSILPALVRTALGYQSLNAPHGVVSIDKRSQHLWKTVRIGEVMANGQFEVVWSSDTPVRPAPFPSSYSQQEWLKKLEIIESP